MKDYKTGKCIDCGKKICKMSKRCHSCANRQRRLMQYGKPKPNYLPKGLTEEKIKLIKKELSKIKDTELY